MRYNKFVTLSKRKKAMLCNIFALLGFLGLSGAFHRSAHALEFYVDGYGGGMYATPTLGGILTQKPTGQVGGEFFALNQGGLLGARVGVEVFYTDVYVQFDQFFNQQGAIGSVFQPMIGWDFDFGQGAWRGSVGGYVGGIFGLMYTPQFPIDKEQIATRGIALEAQVGGEYRLNSMLALQLFGTVGYHYLFGGAIEVDNLGSLQASSTHGFHLMGKLGLRFRLGG